MGACIHLVLAPPSVSLNLILMVFLMVVAGLLVAVFLSVALLMLVPAGPELEALLIVLLLWPVAWTVVIGALLALMSQGKRSLTILGVCDGRRLCVGWFSFMVDHAL